MAKQQLRVVKGDMLTIQKGVLVHQLNPTRIGAGIAHSIILKYPKHLADYNNILRFKTLEEKMGTVIYTKITNELRICGVVAQETYGNARKTGLVYTKYDKLEEGLKEISKIHFDKQIYLPLLIGADLAGGDSKIIHKIIAKHLPNAILVEYQKGKIIK